MYAHIKGKSSIAVVFVHMNTDALACIFNEIQAGIYANLDSTSSSIKNQRPSVKGLRAST